MDPDRPFSLYGVLSPQLDSQWIRVYPIEGRLEPAVAERLDASFVSTDLNTGERHVWRDSLVQDAFDQAAHVFWAPFRAEYSRTYRIEVSRSDGAVSHLDVQMPGEAELVTLEPVGSAQVIAPVLVSGDVPHVLKVEVTYDVRYRIVLFNEFGEPVDTSPEREAVTLSSDGRGEQTNEGWLIRINLTDDFRNVRAMLQEMQMLSTEYGIVLLEMQLQLIAAGAEWDPPGGVFDPDVLIQPEMMSNVENGFGFVGAGYRLQKRWLPPDDALQASGFRVQ